MHKHGEMLACKWCLGADRDRGHSKQCKEHNKFSKTTGYFTGCACSWSWQSASVVGQQSPPFWRNCFHSCKASHRKHQCRKRACQNPRRVLDFPQSSRPWHMPWRFPGFETGLGLFGSTLPQSILQHIFCGGSSSVLSPQGLPLLWQHDAEEVLQWHSGTASRLGFAMALAPRRFYFAWIGTVESLAHVGHFFSTKNLSL